MANAFQRISTMSPTHQCQSLARDLYRRAVVVWETNAKSGDCSQPKSGDCSQPTQLRFLTRLSCNIIWIINSDSCTNKQQTTHTPRKDTRKTNLPAQSPIPMTHAHNQQLYPAIINRQATEDKEAIHEQTPCDIARPPSSRPPGKRQRATSA